MKPPFAAGRQMRIWTWVLEEVGGTQEKGEYPRLTVEVLVSNGGIVDDELACTGWKGVLIFVAGEEGCDGGWGEEGHENRSSDELHVGSWSSVIRMERWR